MSHEPNASPTPAVENSASRKQIRQARRTAKALQRQFDEALERVLNDTPKPGDGQRLFRHYIGFCGVFHGGRSSTEDLHFNEGKRNVGLKLLADVERARPDLISILKEPTHAP